jgi:hypothetical protein
MVNLLRDAILFLLPEKVRNLWIWKNIQEQWVW